LQQFVREWVNTPTEVNLPMYRHLILDLDETLYPRGAGLMDAVGRRMLLYLTSRLGFAPDEAADVKKRFFARYGTTLRGLQVEYQVDADDYLRFVHDVPVENYIAPDPALDAMLGRCSLPKAIFTNADAAHARRVMERLGVAHHFSAIVDIHATGFHCKPDPEAYRRLLMLLDATGPACILVEDMARNLRPARELGMTTVLVDGDKVDGVDYAIPNLLELEGLLGRLASRP
jgi:putative hydrolase of the HAD superfamily